MRYYNCGVKFVVKILSCLLIILLVFFPTWTPWNYMLSGRRSQLQKQNNLMNLVKSINNENHISNSASENVSHNLLSDDSILLRLGHCSSYFMTGQFPILSLDTSLMELEEQQGMAEFPLAFSHLVHHQIGILEAFLALYFRPYNIHIIHIDSKASVTVKESVHRLAKCYQQKFKCKTCIFIAEDSVAVDWANSVLEAEMINLRSLLAIPRWKFVISVAGSELPVMSYLDFVKQIHILPEHGAAFDSYVLPEDMFYRLTDIQRKSSSRKEEDNLEYLIEESSSNSAIWISLYMGSRYVVMSRARVDFVVLHPVARAFYRWLQGMLNKEETFYATMLRVELDKDTGIIKQNHKKTSRAHNKVRGGPSLVLWGGICLRIVFWYPDEGQCHGQEINNVCNFGLEDVAERLEKWDCIMANKFNLEVDARAVLKQMDYVIQKSKV